MLQILLTILKILLWIILGILGLILLLVLLVLFAPIKYKVDAKYYGMAKVKAKINFLIASVTVNFDQETKELDNVIRICGIPLKLDGNDKPKKPKKEKKKNIKNSDEGNVGTDNITPTEGENVENGEDIQTTKVDVTVDEVKQSTEKDSNTDDTKYDVFEDTDSLPKEEKTLFGRIKVLFKKIWDKLVKVKDFLVKVNPDTIAETIDKKTLSTRRTIHRFKIFWDMKCTVKTREYLKKYLKGLFRHIAPRKIKGNIKFGFDEPYKTGQIIGYLSMMPFVYQKDLIWEPDFYNKVMEGELFLKGRIRLGYIARIVLNINIWKTIKAARKIKV